MGSRKPVVVIVAYADVPELAELGFDQAPFMMAGESRALALIARRPLAGLIVIVDGSRVLATARTLVEAYVRSQPTGRVAILSRAPAATLSSHFAFLPDRIDMFFTPWDGKAVREFLERRTPVPACARG